MKKFFIGALIGVCALVAVGVFVAYGFYKAAPARYNVLVVGTDQRADERSRSDVLMVFSIPKNPERQATLLTIPRDTYVDIEGYGKDKITHAYVYGDAKDDRLGNIDLTQQTVEDFLGIHVHATLEYNFESFKEIVDSLGGVTVAGEKLDGEDALAIVRNRYRDGGDFARTTDQREVFQGILTKARDRANAQSLLAYMETSENARLQYSTIDGVQFVAALFVRSYGNVAMPNIVEEVIPGAGARKYADAFGKELYFWVPDEEELEVMLVRAVRD